MVIITLLTKSPTEDLVLYNYIPRPLRTLEPEALNPKPDS